MGGKLRKMPDVCRAEGCKVLSILIEIREIPANVETVRNEKIAIERSNARMLGDMGTTHTKLDKASSAFHVAEVRKKARNVPLRGAKCLVQIKAMGILNTNKVAEAQWRESSSAVKVLHAAERCPTSEMLEGSGWIETLQRAHATINEKASAVLQESVLNMMMEKDLLTARVVEPTLGNQCVLGQAKDATGARGLCM